VIASAKHDALEFIGVESGEFCERRDTSVDSLYTCELAD